jgi:adenylyltransferase/sulfurtransferase
MTPEQRERYARHILLREVGGQGQQKLMDARVLVVGAGGLGSPILQYLAAAGVGMLGISDDDDVSLSNLQRQVMFQTDDVGRSKTDRAAAFIERLNPDVAVNTHPRVDEGNADETVSNYDLVVEGVDNFAARYVVNHACIARKIPLVSAAVGRFEGQLSTYKPFEQPGVLPCYRCLVPEEPPRDQQVNCAEEGVLGAVTGVLGTLAAMEVLKELLGVGESLAGRLLLYDGVGGTFRTIRLPADPACADCSKLSG